MKNSRDISKTNKAHKAHKAQQNWRINVDKNLL